MKKGMKEFALILLLISPGFLFADDCPCCKDEISPCNLALKKATNINIDMNFQQTSPTVRLFAIERCKNPYEILRNTPKVSGKIAEGKFKFVLCDGTKLLSMFLLDIKDNYKTHCTVTDAVYCQDSYKTY